jgi:hypothetical protein
MSKTWPNRLPYGKGWFDWMACGADDLLNYRNRLPYEKGSSDSSLSPTHIYTLSLFGSVKSNGYEAVMMISTCKIRHWETTPCLGGATPSILCEKWLLGSRWVWAGNGRSGGRGGGGGGYGGGGYGRREEAHEYQDEREKREWGVRMSVAVIMWIKYSIG